MFAVEIFDRLGPTELLRIRAFVEELTGTLGRRPLSDHLWLDLLAGGAPGFVGVSCRTEDGLVAWGQISAVSDGGMLEVAVSPTLGAVSADRVAADAARTAVDAFRRQGGGHLTWWTDAPSDEVVGVARDLGLGPTRSLHEMRRALPADATSDVETRAFRPGEDDEEWIRVNNRAFADHDEQGGWTAETLALRMSEPWFDPSGFRIHERDGRIAGFCWTKLHRDHDPVMGEIYVIAVDPDFHGQGLGRSLTLAGLDSITARDVRLADLWVDAGNTAAVSLYDRLGFSIHRTRRAFAGVLTPTETP